MALSATFSGVTKVLRACEIVSSLEGESSGAMRSNALIVGMGVVIETPLSFEFCLPRCKLSCLLKLMALDLQRKVWFELLPS